MLDRLLPQVSLPCRSSFARGRHIALRVRSPSAYMLLMFHLAVFCKGAGPVLLLLWHIITFHDMP